MKNKVGESITRQEQIIAEIQDLYQPFIQERGGGGGAREDALKALASVSVSYLEILCLQMIFSGL